MATLLCFFKVNSQNTEGNTIDIMGTINGAGNNATGSLGTVSYSIG